MKPKQLANVLIKILGLSVCVHGLPGLISGLLMGLLSLTISIRSFATTSVGYVVTAGIEVVIGVVLIVKSGGITDALFKNEGDQS